MHACVCGLAAKATRYVSLVTKLMSSLTITVQMLTDSGVAKVLGARGQNALMAPPPLPPRPKIIHPLPLAKSESWGGATSLAKSKIPNI